MRRQPRSRFVGSLWPSPLCPDWRCESQGPYTTISRQKPIRHNAIRFGHDPTESSMRTLLPKRSSPACSRFPSAGFRKQPIQRRPSGGSDVGQLSRSSTGSPHPKLKRVGAGRVVRDASSVEHCRVAAVVDRLPAANRRLVESTTSARVLMGTRFNGADPRRTGPPRRRVVLRHHLPDLW